MDSCLHPMLTDSSTVALSVSKTTVRFWFRRELIVKIYGASDSSSWPGSASASQRLQSVGKPVSSSRPNVATWVTIDLKCSSHSPRFRWQDFRETGRLGAIQIFECGDRCT